MELPAKNNEIYEYLRELTLCNICCLRYFKGRYDDYLNVKQSLIEVCIKKCV